MMRKINLIKYLLLFGLKTTSKIPLQIWPKNLI